MQAASVREIDGKTALPLLFPNGMGCWERGLGRERLLGLPPAALLTRREIRCCEEMEPTGPSDSPLGGLSVCNEGHRRKGPWSPSLGLGGTTAIRGRGGMRLPKQRGQPCRVRVKGPWSLGFCKNVPRVPGGQVRCLHGHGQAGLACLC